MQLTIIPESLVRSIATLDLAFMAVSRAFEAVALEEAQLMPVVFADGGQAGASFGVKGATHLKAQLLGLKVGSYFPANRQHGVPSHGSTTLLLNAQTGLPHALVSAGYLNGLRTAAANAIAVEYLARQDATVLGVLGAGHQAEFEIRAVAHRRPLHTIKIWNRSPESAEDLRHRLQDLAVEVLVVPTPRDAVIESDIITTVTPSREPLVERDWVRAGTHISAMGTDMIGKQELDPKLATISSCFADLPEQSIRIGEFQHAAKNALITADDITPIGKVILGQHPGRASSQEITVFDSSGIAPQDLHVAAAVVEVANAQGAAVTMDF
jgi:ornithine cyclodeaminase